MHSRLLPDHDSLYVKGLAQKGSPPQRDDDKDGHYMFELGENLTTRCNYKFFSSPCYICVRFCLIKIRVRFFLVGSYIPVVYGIMCLVVLKSIFLSISN